MKNNDRQAALWAEYKEYEWKTMMTGEERQLLKQWVSEGNSVYDNGDMVYYGDGRPMHFIDALRFVDDLMEYGEQPEDHDDIVTKEDLLNMKDDFALPPADDYPFGIKPEVSE